ncbi:hypothetical protein TorRG33x02_339610 [Trema orientale]|uniref:Uncharacterized protein n=1 Tax=Trema orientale TaxID=63057 RepID=A0A2P5AW98_TREOI|nr:hypothetical protein TorRG33x02_339610 [Trema orientale]
MNKKFSALRKWRSVCWAVVSAEQVVLSGFGNGRAAAPGRLAAEAAELVGGWFRRTALELGETLTAATGVRGRGCSSFGCGLDGVTVAGQCCSAQQQWLVWKACVPRHRQANTSSVNSSFSQTSTTASSPASLPFLSFTHCHSRSQPILLTQSPALVSSSSHQRRSRRALSSSISNPVRLSTLSSSGSVARSYHLPLVQSLRATVNVVPSTPLSGLWFTCLKLSSSLCLFLSLVQSRSRPTRVFFISFILARIPSMLSASTTACSKPSSSGLPPLASLLTTTRRLDQPVDDQLRSARRPKSPLTSSALLRQNLFSDGW